MKDLRKSWYEPFKHVLHNQENATNVIKNNIIFIRVDLWLHGRDLKLDSLTFLIFEAHILNASLLYPPNHTQSQTHTHADWMEPFDAVMV